MKHAHTSSVRLYLQHWMWRRQVKYLLLPAITSENTILEVADIGCGTGIWLIDLAEQLPRAKLVGYDVSPLQFPPPEWLPRNVKLEVLDALAEVPSSLVENYDVVHIGLLVLVVGDNPLPLLRNVIRMLKPNGYIQWDEADLGGLFRTTSTPTTSKDSLEELYDLVDKRFNRARLSHSWVRSLDELFRQEGLVVIEYKQFPIPNEIAHPWTHMHLLSLGELIKDIEKSGEDSHKWLDLHAGAIEEARHGASVRMNMVVAVGRKPSKVQGTIASTEPL
ncbi:MAG: hypothetical protein LQ339_006618 [Xanthoria mediterranea]|nr:MAG: hypothetical protein LQ339_006618 [Xanthoria mediterranea]